MTFYTHQFSLQHSLRYKSSHVTCPISFGEKRYPMSLQKLATWKRFGLLWLLKNGKTANIRLGSRFPSSNAIKTQTFWWNAVIPCMTKNNKLKKYLEISDLPMLSLYFRTSHLKRQRYYLYQEKAGRVHWVRILHTPTEEM